MGFDLDYKFTNGIILLCENITLNKLLPLVAFSILLLVPLGTQNAFAIVFSCSANMLGANEVPPSGSAGIGTLTGTFDTNTNQLNWNISWSGLPRQETGMHFHGPATPIQNAGLQVDIGAISGLASPSIGNTVIGAADKADLLAGLWYVNLHTHIHPPGAIRGQVACDQVVGEEIIPIDTTFPLLASAQTFSWMIPVILSVLGIGLFVVSRKSKNS